MPDFRSCRALRLPWQALRINFDLWSKSRHPSAWRHHDRRLDFARREREGGADCRTTFDEAAARYLRGAYEMGADIAANPHYPVLRSEEHTSELQSLMRNSYAVFCL